MAALNGSFRRPPTAQEAVLGELRRLIASGELAPGEQVVQDVLADRLGVSRVPIREALRMLEGEGQVAYHPHRGYFVADLSLADLLEVYRIRALLEAEALRRAVPALTDADLAGVEAAEAAVLEAEAGADLMEMAQANRAFHFALLEPCGMPRLVRLIRQLWDATDPYRSLYYRTAEHRTRVHAEHAAAVEAARRRDVEAVVRVLADHRAHAVEALSAVLR